MIYHAAVCGCIVFVALGCGDRKMATKKATSWRGKLTGAERLIGYCGLYCGDCGGYTGAIANLARDLSRMLKQERFAEFAPVLAQVPSFKAFEHYAHFDEVLEMLPKL